MLGYIYLKRKDFPKALDYFQRQMIARPDNRNAFDSLAYCYFRAGKVAEAKTLINRCMRNGRTRSPSTPFNISTRSKKIMWKP